jgi:uncharacterized RDD family membrane protein YckC
MDSGSIRNTLHFSYQQQGPGSGYTPYSTPPPGGPDGQLADVGPRILAFLIDGLVIGAIVLVGYILAIVLAVGGAATGSDAGSTAGSLFALLIWLVCGLAALGFWFYNQILTVVKTNGQTLGKKWMKIRIVKEDGTQITYGDAFLRNLVGYWISGLVCYLGFIWGLFDARRQAWHDKIFKTLVVKA